MGFQASYEVVFKNLQKELLTFLICACLVPISNFEQDTNYLDTSCCSLRQSV
jgi:hypothetical protein